MDVDDLKTGCRVGPPDARNLQASRVLDLAALPKPPADWLRISQRVKTWPVYANDRLNDCTTAAVGHKIMAATGWAGHLHVPTEQSIVDLYWATGQAGQRPLPERRPQRVATLDR